jgi:hypothetical protein
MNKKTEDSKEDVLEIINELQKTEQNKNAD